MNLIKSITVASLIFICSIAKSQKDTITQVLTGYEYEFYNNKMHVGIINDTVSTSYLVYVVNRITWGDNEKVGDVSFVIIGDSVSSLFSSAFESIINSTNIQSYENMYGVFDLSKIEIEYFSGQIAYIIANYDKTDKSPKGVLTDRKSVYSKKLTESQTNEFKLLLESEEIKSLYFGVYNEEIGN